MFTINDLTQNVVGKLRGRSDLRARIPVWIQNVVKDFTQSYPFEELSLSCPVTQFVPGTSRYKIPYFLGTEVNTRFTRILSWIVYYTSDLTQVRVSPIQGLGVGTTVVGSLSSSGISGFNMKGRAFPVVDQLSTIKGIPTLYAQQGQVLVVGNNPDQAYVTKLTVQKEHPFLSTLGDSQIYMPDDWRELIEYAAAMRGCDEIGMNDVGNIYYRRLYGDPKQQGDLGLLQARVSQQQRNMTNNERQFRLVMRKT